MTTRFAPLLMELFVHVEGSTCSQLKCSRKKLLGVVRCIDQHVGDIVIYKEDLLFLIAK